MVKKDKIAFVLGGGSIKGAYQLGQMKALIDNGIYPDMIVGISVGSLNGALFTQFRRYFTNKESIKKMMDFWFKNINSPKDLVKKKSIIKLIYEIAFNKFNGFVETSKLDNLLYETLDRETLNSSPVAFSAGAVDIKTGRIQYRNTSYKRILDHIIASSRIPFTMPIKEIEGEKYYDGGLIDNAGVSEAIDLDADRLYILATHAEEMNTSWANTKNLLELFDVILDISVHNTLKNDLNQLEFINNMDDAELKLRGYKRIPYLVLRPSEELRITITNFTKEDIINMFMQGYKDTYRTLILQ